MRDVRAQAKLTVSALLAEVDRGSVDSVSATVERLSDPRQTDLLRAVLDELLELSAIGVDELAGGPGADATYMVEVCDEEGNPADIDRVDPPQRAVIRALLARLAGHREDVADQLELALSSGDPEDAADVLATVLLWTMDTMPETES